MILVANIFRGDKLQQLNRQVGVEFTLFVTRGALQDEMEPFYMSSPKAGTFFEGHINLPPKDLLTLMDLSVIGGVGSKYFGCPIWMISTSFKSKHADLSAKVKTQKEIHRQAVRAKLNASFCRCFAPVIKWPFIDYLSCRFHNQELRP